MFSLAICLPICPASSVTDGLYKENVQLGCLAHEEGHVEDGDVDDSLTYLDDSALDRVELTVGRGGIRSGVSHLNQSLSWCEGSVGIVGVEGCCEEDDIDRNLKDSLYQLPTCITTTETDYL